MLMKSGCLPGCVRDELVVSNKVDKEWLPAGLRA
jgi:hypothetical protein